MEEDLETQSDLSSDEADLVDSQEDPEDCEPRMKKSRTVATDLLRRDIFTARANWKEIAVPGSSSEVAAAVAGVSAIASQVISGPTRRSYTQVYNHICEYAKTLNPPVVLDIAAESIPPGIIISYMRVVYTGKGHPVVDEQGGPLNQHDGQPRLGKGLAESTFRKIYHGLRTLHVHFQQRTEYTFDPDTRKHKGNSCNDPAVVRTYRGYLKMFNNREACEKYGRILQGPERAKVFQISQLLAMQQATRQHSSGPLIRAWTYILLSCSLLLRKAEAADLLIGDIEVPVNRETGEPLLNSNLPKYLFIHIRHSKTDQDGHGQRLLLRRNIKNPKLCPVIALMTWLTILRNCYGVKSDIKQCFVT